MIEGIDYEKWVYPRLGNERWLGDYHISHQEPPIVIKEGGSIKNGQKLHVSFYHAIVIRNNQVSCCLSSEEVFQYIEEQVTQIDKYLSPRKFFITDDEIRVAGWCGLCDRESMTTGDLIAANTKKHIDVVRSVKPQAEIFIWSDMFDPYHNAVKQYYLCRGGTKNSWKGLPANTVIVNWNKQKQKESLEFFKDLGLRQLFSVSNNYKKYSVLPGTPGVNGVMYAPWGKDYTEMGVFFREVNGR